ncbi:APC family permease [Seonamhaeicola maritimus]|uniref:Amino acid permease n=1 Tax=Seonamhaeicola maritimus TaxID=2591822 RepID=A0A5C7GLH3_9FLAO|nr:APC family permease [Seonamhaeicola maritimus]TXG39178.1 amino acid permease [Seonamhaeicola maritimus]
MNIKDKGLKRSIGVVGLSANIINIIIGAGIFALPAIIASKMGASSIVAYIFCGILIALVMLCFAEAGSKITNTGGPYTYIETAFGNYAGFLGGIFAIGAALFADAAVSNALINIIGSAFPVFENTWLRVSFLFVIFGGLVYVNIIGLKQGIGLVKFNTVAKLIPLLILVTIGWIGVDFTNLEIECFPEISTIGETALILFFAFQGAETGLVVGGEVLNPKKTVPKAIFISITTVVVLYILIQSVSQGLLGSSLPNFEAAPLAESAKVSLGPIGFTILFIGAIISMFGFLSGSVLNNPRILYALSRDNIIKLKVLSKIHKSFATPYISIICYGIIGFTLAISGSFKSLAIIASSAMLLVYLGVALSVIKLRISQKGDRTNFKIPGGITIPLLSILIISYFLSNISREEMIGTAIFIGALTIIFFLLKILNKK